MKTTDRPYFDLHLHASLKHFLTLSKRGNRKSLWKNITHWSSPMAKLLPSVRSQSSLSQLQSGAVQMAVVGICPLEVPLARMIRRTKVASMFTPIREHFIKGIATQEFSYYQLLLNELEFLVQGVSGSGARMLNQIGDLEENKVNLLLSIEGGHALLSHGAESALTNLQELKESSNRFLYLTLTHLTQNPLSNHAFGMKKVMGQKIKDPAFMPGSVGLSPLGREVITSAYNKRHQGSRILIDIKHMSLKARLDFYQMRKEEGLDHLPIIASHCAATGFSYHELERYIDLSASSVVGDQLRLVYRHSRDRRKRFFNPWSINLYDEDIRQIVSSGGLIGLIMDERILGRADVPPEYFQKDEFAQVYPSLYRKISCTSNHSQGYPLGKPDSREKGQHKRRQVYYLCRNILHMVKAGGLETWNHLCMGSDFDGLINPINDCRTTLEFARLEGNSMDSESLQQVSLIHTLQVMAIADPEIGKPIPNIEEKVRGIMYNNAHRFLKQHFD